MVTSHTGLPAEAGEAFLDESGRLFLASDLGLGIVHTLDMGVAADVVERGVWRPEETSFAALVDSAGDDIAHCRDCCGQSLAHPPCAADDADIRHCFAPESCAP